MQQDKDAQISLETIYDQAASPAISC